MPAAPLWATRKRRRIRRTMDINLHVFHHYDDLPVVKLLKRIAMNMQELTAEMVALKAQNDKARAEVLQKIADLEAAVANAGNTTPEVDAAFADLKASVQTDDDIVTDTPAP